ncbi:type II secretion system F family protein [Rothia kristinae]|uniref:type II secretion system F family protein n=1 Tax=Rothia kristinae TaxID=37923 RepID=UPI0022E0286B|nr:type II secretion system F family protein [Rothia kristinae]
MTSTPLSALILLGLMLALGLGLIWAGLPQRRRITFADRIAPQLRSAGLRSSLLSETPDASDLGNAFVRVLRPLVQRLAAGRLLRGGPAETRALQRRLVKAGARISPVEFRGEQLMCAAAGAGLGLLVVALGWANHVIAALPGLVLVAVCAVCGFMLRDYLLSHRIAAREKRMLGEFPVIAELMALSVTAGESALAALERICRSSDGELSEEFRAVLADARAGVGVVEAMQAFAQRIDLPSLSRFVDGITVAIERGTPLADVLRSQAQDVRDQAKRDLMEVAGKKEIAMMAPVVFLILPLTVVFAVFPGLAAIDIGL